MYAKNTNACRASDMPLHPEVFREQLLDAEGARLGRANLHYMLSKAYTRYSKRSVVNIGRCWC